MKVLNLEVVLNSLKLSFIKQSVSILDFSKEIQESVQFFSNDEFDTNDEITVCGHWEVCYSYRHRNITKKMFGEVDRILEVWPHLSKPFGSMLVSEFDL